MTIEFLKAHRTIRSYSSKEVSKEMLDEVLQIGIRASNTGNMQLYSVIVTTDNDLKAQLSPLHFNQSMVKQAPVVLTICYDFNRFYSWCRLNNTNTDFSNLLWLLNGTIDASILAQNICVGAEYYGLGICYLGTTLYNAHEIGAVLELPKGVIPVTTLTIGYPNGVPEIADRLSLDSVIHWEKYSDYTDAQITEIYSEKENLESSGKFVEENRKDNLAQVYTEVRYKTADSIYFSEKLKKMLIDQGFVL
jgi:nitroreductase